MRTVAWSAICPPRRGKWSKGTPFHEGKAGHPISAGGPPGLASTRAARLNATKGTHPDRSDTTAGPPAKLASRFVMQRRRIPYLQAALRHLPRPVRDQLRDVDAGERRREPVPQGCYEVVERGRVPQAMIAGGAKFVRRSGILARRRANRAQRSPEVTARRRPHRLGHSD